MQCGANFDFFCLRLFIGVRMYNINRLKKNHPPIAVQNGLRSTEIALSCVKRGGGELDFDCMRK